MYKNCLKRVIDFCISLCALIVLSPFLLVFMIIGWIVMKGDPFFYQERPGKDEKIFKLMKFRSMTEEKDENGDYLPDEKPELINILKGDMAIVGPRPLLVKYLPLYNEAQHHRHDVRPGLTGLAMANGRNSLTWKEKFDYDIEYVNNVSFLLDVKIILKTVKGVLKREGVTSPNSATVEEFKGNEEE